MIGSLNAAYVNRIQLDGGFAAYLYASGSAAQAAQGLSSSGGVLVQGAAATQQQNHVESGMAFVTVQGGSVCLQPDQALSSAGVLPLGGALTGSQDAHAVTASAVWKSTQYHVYTDRLGAAHTLNGGMAIHSIHGSVARH